MTSPTVIAIFGVVCFGALGAFLLIIPRLWRPEVPFGVSVPTEGTEEVRGRALRFWTISVILLTAGAIAATLVLARFRPEMWIAQAFIAPYVALGVLFYTRARRMVLPAALPSRKVGAALRRRRYRDYMSPWSEVIPAGLVVLGLVLSAWMVLRPPRAAGSGVWELARTEALQGAIIAIMVVYPLGLLTAVLMAHAKQSIGGGDAAVSLAASEAFRKVWIRYTYAFRLWLAAVFVIIPGCLALGELGLIGIMPALPFLHTALVVGGLTLLLAGAWIINLRYGQGGWRWAVRQGLVEKSQVAAILDGDGMQDDRWKLGMFYFNPKDPSILVERRFGVGWTLNLGNIWAIVLIFFGIVGVCVLPSLLSVVLRPVH